MWTVALRRAKHNGSPPSHTWHDIIVATLHVVFYPPDNCVGALGRACQDKGRLKKVVLAGFLELLDTNYSRIVMQS